MPRPVSELAAAIKRARRAFRLNNIPWDTAWGRIPVERLNWIAECWERRAAGQPVDEAEEAKEADRLTIGEAKRILAGVARKLRGNGNRDGHRRFIRQQIQYHGQSIGGQRD